MMAGRNANSRIAHSAVVQIAGLGFNNSLVPFRTFPRFYTSRQTEVKFCAQATALHVRHLAATVLRNRAQKGRKGRV